ncbi:MAG: hypothetical protein JW384_01564 [Nitrosomonadaceae bacterium]|nr:hypothetical protein [Nitrosomonadaceae bacterium]
MGRRAEKTRFIDKYVILNVRMKGKQKNEIIDYARKKNLAVNDVMLYAVWEFIRNEKGIPDAGSAQYSIPTIQETVLAYIRGDNLLQPCGLKECEQKITQLNNMQFCETCNIRIQ